MPFHVVLVHPEIPNKQTKNENLTKKRPPQEKYSNNQHYTSFPSPNTLSIIYKKVCHTISPITKQILKPQSI